jgi:hypothetical protein
MKQGFMDSSSGATLVEKKGMTMKCVYHPDNEATAQCGRCEQPLCEQCVVRKGSNLILCSRCVALGAAQEAVHGAQERLEDREARKQGRLNKKEKKARLRLFIPACCIPLILVIGLIVNAKLDVPVGDPFIPADHPQPTAMIIDQAVKTYMKDHEGEAPANLMALRHGYLLEDILIPDVLDLFLYRRITTRSYELRLKNDEDEAMLDFSFTESGWKMGGMQ